MFLQAIQVPWVGLKPWMFLQAEYLIIYAMLLMNIVVFCLVSPCVMPGFQVVNMLLVGCELFLLCAL